MTRSPSFNRLALSAVLTSAVACGGGEVQPGPPAVTDAGSEVVVDLLHETPADEAIAEVDMATEPRTLQFLETATIATGASPTGLTTGDFDHDGLADIVVLHLDGSLVFLHGLGDGRFRSSSSQPAGAGNCRSFASGDLDR